jgi:nucleotide-binding universal stress UspA family protein
MPRRAGRLCGMAFERVVVGIDGSGGGDDALAWAIDWAQRSAGEVVAVFAVGLLWNSRSGRPVPSHAHRDEIRERFESEWLAPLDRSGVRARKLLRDGPAASVLLAAAAEVDADLVVVGKRGSGPFEAAMLGSSALQVAEHAACPVLIVPDGHAPEQVASVVVGVDGSAPAESALRWAVELAGLVGAPLTVAHALDESFASLGTIAEGEAGGGGDDPAIAEAVDELRSWCAPVLDAGVEVALVVERGDAATQLVRLSQPTGTVVVVGSRGRGGFDELRLGSVSNRVVHHARSPVAVVHAGREQA